MSTSIVSNFMVKFSFSYTTHLSKCILAVTNHSRSNLSFRIRGHSASWLQAVEQHEIDLVYYRSQAMLRGEERNSVWCVVWTPTVKTPFKSIDKETLISNKTMGHVWDGGTAVSRDLFHTGLSKGNTVWHTFVWKYHSSCRTLIKNHVINWARSIGHKLSWSD